MMPPLMRTALPGLLLTLAVGSLPFPVWDREFADAAHMVGNEAIYWALVGATLAYVRLVEKRPWASIGLRRPSWRDLALGAACALATLALLAATYYVVFPAIGIDESAQINQLLAAPGWWLCISVMRAAVSEEVLFRGYPVERLQELTGRRWVAALLPLLVFSLAHVGPWGSWAHAAVAAIGGGMFTLLYLWRRNLWANMLAHGLVDGIAVLG